MKLLEYKAKELFDKYGIPTMNGCVIDSADGMEDAIKNAGLSYPVVVKAQVQIGGRGKAGGIQFADNAAEAAAHCKRLLHSELRGFTVNQLMIVEKANPIKEWYISILLDRDSKCPLLIFSPVGGMEIEETARTNPEKVAKIAIDPFRGVQGYTIDYIMDVTGADKKYKEQLTDIVKKLFTAFFGYNTMLVEINPLVIDESDKLIALDGKVEIDDSALRIGKLPDIAEFRDQLQEDPRVKEARGYGLHFVPLDDNGTIGIMSNGSGMMMSCLDLITQRGMSVGECMDQGGGATRDKLKEAVRIMFLGKNINVVLVYIFGGITRCDEVAMGIKMALEEQPADKKVVVRIEGTNKEQAMEIIATMGDRVVAVDNVPGAVDALWALLN
ncbi:MAG: ADP-forming succinate--CoA ligase subunit beta [Oscillospiraceae bacterium]